MHANTVVITPSLPPRQCGLGDFTVQLWRHLLGDAHEQVSLDATAGWSFLVARDSESSKNMFTKAVIGALPDRADALCRRLLEMEVTTVILQFVGYGYDRYGLPNYLIDGLSKWKKADSNHRLVTMFHETWAAPVFGSNTLFLSPLQKALARKLIGLSNVSITSNGLYAAELAGISANHTRPSVIPIGSNFGQTSANGGRKPIFSETDLDYSRLLIFGLKRSSAIAQHADLIHQLTQRGLIKSIVLAGNNASNQAEAEIIELKKHCCNAEIITAFEFEAADIPLSVRACGLSLNNGHPAVLAKSTRFHLSSSLGQIVIARRLNADAEPPLIDRENFLSYSDSRSLVSFLETTDLVNLQRMSKNCFELSETYFSWSNIALSWKRVLSL